MITLRFRNLSVAVSLFLVWSLSMALVRPVQAQGQPRPEDRKVPAAEALKQITEDYEYLGYEPNLTSLSRPICPSSLGIDLLNSELQAATQAPRSRQEFLAYHRSVLSETLRIFRSQGYAKASALARMNEAIKALKDRVAQGGKLERR